MESRIECCRNVVDVDEAVLWVHLEVIVDVKEVVNALDENHLVRRCVRR